MKIGHAATEAAAATAGVGSVRGQDNAKAAIEQHRPAQAQGDEHAAAGSVSAQVQLSAAASSLLEGAGGAQGDFDAEKVERIAKAIAEGSFVIHPEVIADKLIANAQELLGKVGR